MKISITEARRRVPEVIGAAMRAIRRALKNRHFRPARETAIEGLHAERHRRGE